MRNALAKNGAELIAADVQSSASRQMIDIENLITQEVDVVIINAHDAQAILPVCSIATGYRRLRCVRVFPRGRFWSATRGLQTAPLHGRGGAFFVAV